MGPRVKYLDLYFSLEVPIKTRKLEESLLGRKGKKKQSGVGEQQNSDDMKAKWEIMKKNLSQKRDGERAGEECLEKPYGNIFYKTYICY